ncbi:hypothetical protein FSP39_013394 [Pinctada imbricata]|uniref:TauD/TfdA-like domain-containing protein n=1 Tax=Pinctada imbricata TaxID=66713 RepID=A0AA88Y006_PINIB|nr:hypothetical protein FSP39_013394 [Pinctada imbricata]
MIDVSAIDPSIQVMEVRLTDSDDLILQWSDNHIGEIPLDFLRLYCYEQPNSTPELSTYFSKASFMGLVLFLAWLKYINTAGVCILKNVPTEDQTVTKVAELISPVQKSIYGTSFDVVSTPNPINVAYSSAHLDFHMDLIYYESAPGLQLLHCMRFDSCVEGGESLLLDIFHVAENFRRSYPVEFHTLSRVPATFQKIHYERESPVHMIYQKPHIMLNHRHEIVSINWAPAFEGPLSVDPEDVELYYEAYHKFAAAIQNSPAIIELKMKPGDLMIFNNRRILHGRKEFNLNGGVRHLQGCYVNIDEFKSKVYVLSNQLGDKEPIKRVGNQCWF